MVTFTSTPFSIRLSGSDFISQWVYGAFSEAELLFFCDSDFIADAALFLLRPPSPTSVSDGALPALPHHYNVYISGYKHIAEYPTYLLCLLAIAAARDLFFGAMFHKELQK